jgi:DNA repair exonuclease SbcCD ATPase subunit
MARATFRIQRVGIEGFKAFGVAQSLNIGDHLFVFGQNGLGKSSVVEAIRWCLFGLADRPEAEVRNVFYSAGECCVDLDLRGPGGIWKMQRRLRPGSGRSDLVIQDPDGTSVPQSKVFPHIARLGPREGTHIIFASQQASHRRPQADITDFDKVLYSYLRVEDIPDLLSRLNDEVEEQTENEKQLAKEVDEVEQSLRADLADLRSRIQESLASAPWPGGAVPTNAETDARIRAFVEECGGKVARSDGGAVTREWLLAEAERAIQQMSASSQATFQNDFIAARAALQLLTTARQALHVLQEQLSAAQTRVETCEADLMKALAGTSKAALVTERDRLMGEDARLGSYLALVQQAASYVESFQPDTCPTCETAADPAELLAELTGRVNSDERSAQLAAGLAAVNARLGAIAVAELTLTAAQASLTQLGTRTAQAKEALNILVDDPSDPASADETAQRLAERVRQLELEHTTAGSLVAIKRAALKNLQSEVRFQEYRAREEGLEYALDTGLEPAREAHREFTEVLDTLKAIHDALRGAFNTTLNSTLPQIGELMTEVYGRLTQQASFPRIVVEPGPTSAARTVRVRVTSDLTPGESFAPVEVLNGQAFNALNLVPYFVFSQFQAEALELDCLLIDDPSQSFDTSRVELLLKELATAATHAQLIVASHEAERFEPFISKYFGAGSYRVLRVTAFAPERGPTLAWDD